MKADMARVRSALRRRGPSTSAEIAGDLGAESTEVHRALYALSRRGEVTAEDVRGDAHVVRWRLLDEVRG